MIRQSVRVRFLMVAAGLLLALCLFFILTGLLHLRSASLHGVVPDLDLNVLRVWKGGPADAAGIKAGDRIVAVNGERLSTMLQFAQRTISVPPGPPVVYTIVREGRLHDVPLTPVPVPVMKKAALAVPAFLIPIAVVSFLYFRRPGNLTNFLFCIFGMCFPPFTLVAFDVAEFTLNRPLFSLWLILLFIMFSFGIHFVLIFPERRAVLRRRPWILWITYGGSAALLGLNLVFHGRVMASPTREHVLRMLNIGLVDMVYAFGVSTAIIAAFLHTYLTSPNLMARKQVKVLFAGAAVVTLVEAVGVALNFQTFYDLLLSDALFPYVTPLIFTTATAIAIQRYRIMDVDRLINKGIIYFLLSGAALGTFLLVAGGLGWVLDRIIGRATTISFAFSALVVALGFAPLSARLQNALNRWFYREHFAFNRFLEEISGDLLSAIDFQSFLSRIVGRCRDLLHITAVEVLFRGPKGLSLPPSDGASTANAVIPEGSPVLAFLEKGTPVLKDRFEDITGDPVSQGVRKAMDDVRAEALVPLLWKGEAVGAIALGPKASETPYDAEDLALLRALANQVAIAREVSRLIQEEKTKVRMAQELATATSIQKNLLPQGDPDIPGLDVASAFYPAWEVSGDYYDYFPYPGPDSAETGFAIADVTGKGVPAALLASMLKSAIEVQVARREASLPMIKSLNNLVYKNGAGMLITFVYALWERERRSLTYSIAGHNFPYLFQARTKTVRFLEQEAFPLGADLKTVYREDRIALEPGDVVIFYTDGVVEALNDRGEMLGYETFEAIIRDYVGKSPSALKEAILQAVRTHCGNRPLSDDVTLVIARVTGDRPEEPLPQQALR